MRHRNTWVTSLLVLAGLVTASPAWSQAFCSLRDPVNAIDTLVPSREGYESLVVEIESDLRRQLHFEAGLTLHAKELGKHTLYKVLTPEGRQLIVQVRPEATRWGIIEFAWLLEGSPDGKFQIADMYVQRCRTARCEAPLVDSTAASLIGRSEEENLSLLRAATPVGGDASRAQQLDDEMRTAILSSGVKTQLLTRALAGGRL